MNKEQIIIESMARAIFLQAYSMDGGEDDHIPIISFNKAWMDRAPITPPEAINTAYRLTGKLEQANGHPIITIAKAAHKADDLDDDMTEEYAKDFGFSLAMEALGNCYPLSFNEEALSFEGKKLVIPTIHFFLKITN